MIELIGICGAAGAGKDSVARGIVQHFGYWAIQPLASPLKNMLETMLRGVLSEHEHVDWDNREWKETVLPQLGFSPRYLAQTLGTEWGRQVLGPDLWLKVAAARLKNRPDYCEGVVIPDIRFENEAVWIREMGGLLLKVIRPANPYRISNPEHASEGGISDELVDYIIENVEGRQHLAVAEARMVVHKRLVARKDDK